MKKLPDEKTLLELLEMAKDAEEKARELCEMGETFAQKYEKRLLEIGLAAKQKA